MVEETHCPVSIFEGLAFVGGLMSMIKALSSIIMLRVNKRQFDKKVNKFMVSK